MTYDLLITDSHVITPKGMVEKNIVVENGKIELITNDAPDCDKKINGSGLVSIPGLVDPHVTMVFIRQLTKLQLVNHTQLQ